MKGFLKGLRFISQILDNEKKHEIQIGYPTDVKHVAHIGWEGPSVSSHSWMNEFTVTLVRGDSSRDDSSTPSEYAGRRCVQSRNLPADQPNSSRRLSSLEGSDGRENSEKHRSRRSSRGKDSSNKEKSKASRNLMDPDQGSDSPTLKLPNMPKKSRRKKSKDSSGGGRNQRIPLAAARREDRDREHQRWRRIDRTSKHDSDP